MRVRDLIAKRRKENAGQHLSQSDDYQAKEDSYTDTMKELLKRIEAGSMRLRKTQSVDSAHPDQDTAR